MESVLPKVTRIIPEASVIGMLLSHQKDPRIVASTQKGILQHDAFTWEVMGPSFIEKESLTRRAAASDRSLHKWIDHMDEKQREHLIGELFSVLEATGADTISQIQEGGLKSLAAMVRQLDKLEPQSKAMVQELITGLFGSWLELLPLPELDKSVFCHNIGVTLIKIGKNGKGTSENERKVVNAALLGLGTVGTGVYKVIKSQEQEMTAKLGCQVKITKILVRNLESVREGRRSFCSYNRLGRY